jgi:protein-S-isoprenylcysteine O-methyltransferase Ste14
MLRTFALARTIVYSAAFIGFWGWVASLVRQFDRSEGWTMPAWLGPIGLIAFAIGAAIVVSCGYFFSVAGIGTPAPFDAPRRFVAVGPYRYVRNPMYIGGFLLIGGAALYLGSPSVLILALALLGAVHLLVVFYEEPILEEKFGESYIAYKQSVNRWSPRFRKD